MEKREHGFSLYLNGAHLSSRQTPHSTVVHHRTSSRPGGGVNTAEPMPSSDPGPMRSRTRPSRTAGMRKFRSNDKKVVVVFCIEGGFVGTGSGTESSDDEEARSKSAPSKRKSWSHHRVALKTAEGRPIQIEVPGEINKFPLIWTATPVFRIVLSQNMP